MKFCAVAYNEELADRIRVYLGAHPGIAEKKMFGGLSFLLHGKMTVGVMKNDLLVRVLAEKEIDLLNQAYVGAMKFTGKAMKEFVSVEAPAFEKEADLYEWIELGIEHAEEKLKMKS